jgi:hypothetical protein
MVFESDQAHSQRLAKQLDDARAERALLLWLNAELEYKIAQVLELTEPHPLKHWDTQWPIRAALEGE